MKILVVGASGQVGSELKQSLNRSMEQGGQQLQVKFADRSDIDLCNLQEIAHYLEENLPDIIVNASAYTSVDKAESHSDMAFLINEAAVRELAIFCRKRKSQLIHISTDYVFDGNSNRPYVESDAVGPTSVYGSSKLAGERAIRKILAEHIILRTSWVFGVRGSNFVKTMLRLAADNDEVSVVCDQYGAPTSARSIAATITKVLRRLALARPSEELWGTYHLSGYPFVSWAEFAKEIFEQATCRDVIPANPRVKPIVTTEYPTLAPRPANSRLDCSKLKNTFGIEPDDWKRSLGLMLDELKERDKN